MKKPQRPLEWLQSTLDAHDTGDDRVVLVGCRGYYMDSMGKKGANDRGIYDDALFWVDLKIGRLASYNGNVDPSSYRKGKGTGSTKGMASLKNGVWRYQPGMHNGSAPHMAYRQAAAVTVIRDGSPNYEDTGWFGINIHRGGTRGTSSLGCQTVPPDQWTDFKKTGDLWLANNKQKTFAYILTDRQG
jgi:lysozyme